MVDRVSFCPEAKRVGGGWSITKFLLTHERQMLARVLGGIKTPPLSQTAAEKVGLTNGMLSDTMLRSKIMNFEMDEEFE